MSVQQEDVIRPTVNFPPSVWGDVFLAYQQQEEEEGIEKVVDDLKEEVKKEILASLNDPTKHLNLLKLVDATQRTSLWFRLMRQQGFLVSSDTFKTYKDKEGCFNESLKSDLEGLLDLYEASYLSMPGEVILDDALDFSRKCLDDMAKNHLLSSHGLTCCNLSIKRRFAKYPSGGNALMSQPMYLMQEIDWLNATYGH
ncbi:unnamed protein product [Lactuca virosa]|uniref:Terpene synthase N-terminal domain-containing protein n=1 Tax=Lactuca virosa TaxID=75947 RepID=A0AAU9NT82_9ASTR|nr:unnamed protein product [Lactuca virosa]